MTSGRALCTTLTLLLVAAQRREDFGEATYDVIGHLVDLADWSDERRADLYARLADSIKADDKLTVMERKVEAALRANDLEFPHG